MNFTSPWNIVRGENMVKKVLCFIFVSFCIFLFSCKSKENNTGSSYASTTSQPKAEEGYMLYADTISAGNIFKIEPIVWPQEINGYGVDLIGDSLTSQGDCFVILRTKEDVDKELGKYSLQSKTYERIIELENEYNNIGVRAFNEQYIVLTAAKSAEEWWDVWLSFIDLKNKKMTKIHHFAELQNQGFDNNGNNILLKDNQIYFDDAHMEGDTIEIDLFRFDIISQKIELLEKNAQNPMLYENDIAFFTIDEEGNYNKLKKLKSREEFEVSDNLQYIDSTNDELYSLINKHTDPLEKITTWAIKNMQTGKIILETRESIDNLQMNESFIVWRSYFSDTPYLYDLKSNKFLAFDKIPKGEGIFLANDYCGILCIAIINDDSEYEMSYYYFEYK